MTPRQRYAAARAAYVLIVLIATLTDLQFSSDLGAASARLARALTPSLGWRDAIDGLRNVVLFAGLGAVWVVTSLSGKVSREIGRAMLAGLALSATVEGMQVFSTRRTASLVDVGTNTLGALFGAVTLAAVILSLRRSKGVRSYIGVPALLAAGCYSLAVLCEAVTPLFHSAPARGLGDPFTRLGLALRSEPPLSLGRVPLVDLFLFAPAGFLVVAMLSERGWPARRSWPIVAVIGTVIAFAAAPVRAMVGLPLLWEACVAHAVALAFGAWAAYRWLPALTTSLRGQSRAAAALFGYVGLLVIWGWRPFLPQVRWSAIAEQFTFVHLVPLASLAQRVDVFSAVHVAQQFVLYVPLGGLLAVWPLRLRGRWSGLWPGLALAAVIELGHALIAGRYLDTTNALLAGAGVAVGWVVVRRSGYAAYGTILGSR
jgi:glycopeptide antibiotics resistance protein